MNLIDALKEEKPQRRCPMAVLRETLTPEENDALTYALRNPTKPAQEIYRILIEAGHTIGEKQIYRHRAGLCPSCGRE